MEASRNIFLELQNERPCPHQMRGTQDLCLSLSPAPGWSPWDYLWFSFVSAADLRVAKKQKTKNKKNTLRKKCKGSRDLREDLPRWSLRKQIQTTMIPLFTIGLAKIFKDWQYTNAGRVVRKYTVFPYCLRECGLLQSFGKVFWLYLLTIKIHIY